MAKLITVYIGGSVSKEDINEARKRFEKAEADLKARGFEVINPVRVIEDMAMQNNSWSEIMCALIPLLCNADVLHLLPCWQRSSGAMLERDIMLRVGKEIFYAN